VVPCFVQCCFVFFLGHGGEWAPDFGGVGCTVQGFYSVLGSSAGMLTTAMVAVLTDRLSRGQALPDEAQSTRIVAGVFAFATLLALLPFATTGYAYSGEGFCYTDWYDPMQAVVNLALFVPAVVVVPVLFLRAKGWPNHYDLPLVALAFLAAWGLWPGAGVVGLHGADFPAGYMISGGILGHAQALINPYLYGRRWRESCIALEAGTVVKDSDSL
jgi:hypothetical protein